MTSAREQCLFNHQQDWSILWYSPSTSHHFWRDYFLFTIGGQVLACLFVVRSWWLLKSDTVILQDTVTVQTSSQAVSGEKPNEERDPEDPEGGRALCGQEDCRCTDEKLCAKTLIRKGFWNLDISYYGIYIFKPNDPAFQAESWLRRCMECDSEISLDAEKGSDGAHECEKCRDMENSRNFFRWRSEKDVPCLPPHRLMMLAMVCMALVTFAHVMVRFLYLKSCFGDCACKLGPIANWISLLVGTICCGSLALLSLTPINRNHVIRNDFAGSWHMPLAYLTFGFLTDVMLAGVASCAMSYRIFYIVVYAWSMFHIAAWVRGRGSVHEWLSALGIFVYFLPQTIEACKIWISLRGGQYQRVGN